MLLENPETQKIDLLGWGAWYSAPHCTNLGQLTVELPRPVGDYVYLDLSGLQCGYKKVRSASTQQDNTSLNPKVVTVSSIPRQQIFCNLIKS